MHGAKLRSFLPIMVILPRLYEGSAYLFSRVATILVRLSRAESCSSFSISSASLARSVSLITSWNQWE